MSLRERCNSQGTSSNGGWLRIALRLQPLRLFLAALARDEPQFLSCKQVFFSPKRFFGRDQITQADHAA